MDPRFGRRGYGFGWDHALASVAAVLDGTTLWQAWLRFWAGPRFGKRGYGFGAGPRFGKRGYGFGVGPRFGKRGYYGFGVEPRFGKRGYGFAMADARSPWGEAFAVRFRSLIVHAACLIAITPV